MKDVIIAFARWTRPDVSVDESQLLDVFEIADKNLVVQRRTLLLRPEVMNRVEIGDVHASRKAERSCRRRTAHRE